ncbi:MAG: imidazole glycerol phosphate synthase subunit HisH, partial [Myxococcales bacterium]|nr:imidazole glycerol phosphate synthase subunit HisH [Myxococcales bacterium]
PGQGAFRDCAAAFHTGLGETVAEAIDGGTPYFGICLGMQVLFESSEEAPGAQGLGFFQGAVRRFASDRVDASGGRLKVPHMGWNRVEGRHALLPAEDWFYFVHSYYCAPTDPSWTVGVAHYGDPFCAAVAKDRVFACQFHPEKSQDAGQDVIRRFLETPWS